MPGVITAQVRGSFVTHNKTGAVAKECPILRLSQAVTRVIIYCLLLTIIYNY